MKVLGLFGSPRRGGNTDLLLEEFLKGTASAGASVEKIYITDKSIAPCGEHTNCQETGECIIKDDMQEIYPRLLSADIVVLAAPMFFYSLPAQAKGLIDRCQVLWARKYLLKRKPPNQTGNGKTRRGFFISVGGTKGNNLFGGAIRTVKYFFDVIGVEYAGELVFRSVDAKGSIKEYPSALAEAFNQGRDSVTG